MALPAHEKLFLFSITLDLSIPCSPRRGNVVRPKSVPVAVGLAILSTRIFAMPRRAVMTKMLAASKLVHGVDLQDGSLNQSQKRNVFHFYALIVSHSLQRFCHDSMRPCAAGPRKGHVASGMRQWASGAEPYAGRRSRRWAREAAYGSVRVEPSFAEIRCAELLRSSVNLSWFGRNRESGP